MPSKSSTVFAVLILGLSAVSCGDDAVSQPPRKGEIDRAALEAGVVVTIDGDLGTVTLPFSVAVPAIGGDTGGGDDQLQSELEGAVSLVVTSSSSGATADLASGSIVEQAPASTGEWNWVLTDDRETANMTFFNSAAGGLTLKSSVSYDAVLSVATNEYIESDDSIAFGVTVVGN
jgi:hypothetical protein